MRSTVVAIGRCASRTVCRHGRSATSVEATARRVSPMNMGRRVPMSRLSVQPPRRERGEICMLRMRPGQGAARVWRSVRFAQNERGVGGCRDAAQVRQEVIHERHRLEIVQRGGLGTDVDSDIGHVLIALGNPAFQIAKLNEEERLLGNLPVLRGDEFQFRRRRCIDRDQLLFSELRL